MLFLFSLSVAFSNKSLIVVAGSQVIKSEMKIQAEEGIPRFVVLGGDVENE